jgi:ketosteroid isomerase-like protein
MSVASQDACRAISEAVETVADEEFRVMEAGDVSRFLDLVTDDVIFFPPNSSPKTGDAVAPWIAEFLQGYTVAFQERRHDELLTSDDWAVLRTSFRWRVAPRAGGDGFVRRGNTVRVFRRAGNGSWQLAREIWNTFSPAGEP